MGIFSNLFSSKANETSEQAVIVHFNYGNADLQPIFDLQKKLDKAIEKANVGEFDSNKIAADYSDAFLYMYGQDADKLYDVIRPILEKTGFANGASVTLRYGPPGDGVQEEKIINS